MDFTDLDSFVSHPRITDLALSPDGSRLIAVVSTPDPKAARYLSALWSVDPQGVEPPARLTHSAKGESAPAFRPDGSLLFTSARPDPQDPDEEESALWRLPLSGEASVVARTPGGVRSPQPARAAATVLVGGSRLVGSTDAEDDESRRKARKDTATTAILHDGMPIRYWDAELGDTSPRLFVTDLDGEVRDLAPDARTELTGAQADLSADGSQVLTTWNVRERGGRSRATVVSIDVADGTRSTVLDDPAGDAIAPLWSPDGTRWAVAWQQRGTFERPFTESLLVCRVGSAEVATVALGDVAVTDYAWSADGAILWVTGNLHGRGAILAVDPATGAVLRRIAADAAYSHLRPAPDGTAIYALRSSIDHPPVPVRLDPAAVDQEPVRLDAPGAVADLPGTVRRVEHDIDGLVVEGWLCTPTADTPAPLMTWIHGGPFTSWNSWSWRWSPWVAIARGYAVLLPDPALSTGYGADAIARAWPHRAAVVWREIEALVDHVLDTDDGLDRDRTALLGASFGGFMTNWIAGHTDRFRAIVTHAGLWALDQQHATTDAAAYKTGIFGTPAEHPEWYAENSPNATVAAIRTPMLITHGNRDYRVPVSEALRLWWDLVAAYDGEPADLPHRFLQLTGENHWVLSPTNAKAWFATVLAFCDQHVRGGEPLPRRLSGS